MSFEGGDYLGERYGPGRWPGPTEKGCTASELDAGTVTCGLAGAAAWGKTAAWAFPVSYLIMIRMFGWLLLRGHSQASKGCEDHGAAP